jgi:hypothetical protein
MIEEHWNVRSREMLSLVIESLVLKKKREYVREKEERDTCEGFYRQKDASIGCAI